MVVDLGRPWYEGMDSVKQASRRKNLSVERARERAMDGLELRIIVN